MHFNTKSYLKSTCNHTAKHAAYHTLLFGEIKQLGMDIEGLENREVSLDVWLKIRILEKEALHEKDPNPKGCAGLNANAGLET